MIIHIFGASGSGPSTLAKAISDQYHYYHMDTDDYFWMPTNPRFTQKRPCEERLALMQTEISAHRNIVLSGSLCGWGDTLIPSFSLAIRLITDTETRICRIKQREYERFGERIQPNGDMHKQHTDFLAWASAYDNGSPDMRSRAMHDAWQKTLPCPVITLDGSQPLNILLQTIKPYIPEVTT